MPDLQHYQQRVNDLAYDAVDLDVAGAAWAPLAATALSDLVGVSR